MKKLLPAILVSATVATTWACLKPGSVSRGEIASPASNQPTAPQRSRVLPSRPEELPEFEKAVRSIYERALPSIGLMFRGPKKEHSGTGVVISRESHVLTHGHAYLTPGTSVTMVFGDGRKAGGKVLGVHRYFDVGLVKLDGEGPCPAVPLGTSASLKPGDLCLAVGYPKAHMTFFHGDGHEKGQPPLLRLGRVLGRYKHHVMASCDLSGGDSGGPLLNLQGEVIGTGNLAGKVAQDDSQVRLFRVAGYTDVDVFQKIRQQLLEEKVFTEADLLGTFARTGPFENIKGTEADLLGTFARTGPFENTKGLDALAIPAHRSVVTVLARDKPVALGLVIAADGWVVTKASALSGPLVCRLADGRKLEASLKGKSEKHDLALLHIRAKDLPAAVWSDDSVPTVARIVANIGPEPTPLSFGMVCSGVGSIPAVKGELARGFSDVFVHDGLLNSQQCGGPVVDATGKAVALTIATRILDDTRTYAIPGAVVRKTVDELRKERPAK
jgi:S1-C subfamily serine protease